MRWPSPATASWLAALPGWNSSLVHSRSRLKEMTTRKEKREKRPRKRCHHAVPDTTLETDLCPDSSHWHCQWISHIRGFYLCHRYCHCRDWRYCRPSRLLHLPEGLR